jgi:ATP-dependent DNA ligase
MVVLPTALPVQPPVAPMLGRLVRELPMGDFVYEPKWDGFRCIAFRDASKLDLRSRHDRPLARYFPELVSALLAVQSDRFVLDGEIVLAGHDFGTLMGRLHPAASRVERLSAEAPASFVAFDLLALDGRDLREEPFRARRAALETFMPSGGRVFVTEATTEPALAREWLASRRAGVDGVIAKSHDLRYREGRRAMLKVKLERALECLVAGFRLLAERPLPSSLLLGLFDEAGLLRHIGIAGSFSERLRRELLEELEPLLVDLEGHPWEHGFLLEGSPVGRLKGAAGRWAPEEMSLDWVPVAPTRVVEVSYDHMDGRRLRHPARFRRWRPDRDPRSCTFTQV